MISRKSGPPQAEIFDEAKCDDIVMKWPRRSNRQQMASNLFLFQAVKAIGAPDKRAEGNVYIYSRHRNIEAAHHRAAKWRRASRPIVRPKENGEHRHHLFDGDNRRKKAVPSRRHIKVCEEYFRQR